ncbi:MAG: prepilin-type N-terminal cleavage/methylation domain-containing protein [Candidatus Pacebacteria bacterium]|nr:prepilin-type N-terminal cleavage/methylation domain-containing protein [Candidatus Paceibacterota bacterium]
MKLFNTEYRIQNTEYSYSRAARKGFTLIEMLVTLGIITLLSTMILAYSRQSESVSDLIRESNRIAFEIQKTKNSAMLTLKKNSAEERKICGWGVYIEKDKLPQESFIVFTDFCGSGTEDLVGNGKYDEAGGEKVEAINLLKGIEIFETNIFSVVFVPPEPKIKFDPKLFGNESAFIKIRLKNNPSQYFEIKISPVGQVYKELKNL